MNHPVENREIWKDVVKCQCNFRLHISRKNIFIKHQLYQDPSGVKSIQQLISGMTVQCFCSRVTVFLISMLMQLLVSINWIVSTWAKLSRLSCFVFWKPLVRIQTIRPLILVDLPCRFLKPLQTFTPRFFPLISFHIQSIIHK